MARPVAVALTCLSALALTLSACSGASPGTDSSSAPAPTTDSSTPAPESSMPTPTDADEAPEQSPGASAPGSSEPDTEPDTAEDTAPDAAEDAAPDAASDMTAGTSSLAFSDPWVKTAEGRATVAFVTLTNVGDEPVTVTDVATPVATTTRVQEAALRSDGSVQFHASGEVTLDPGARIAWEPGGAHLALTGLADPLTTGDVVPFTVTLGDGSTASFEAVAREAYELQQLTGVSFRAPLGVQQGS